MTEKSCETRLLAFQSSFTFSALASSFFRMRKASFATQNFFRFAIIAIRFDEKSSTHRDSSPPDSFRFDHFALRLHTLVYASLKRRSAARVLCRASSPRGALPKPRVASQRNCSELCSLGSLGRACGSGWVPRPTGAAHVTAHATCCSLLPSASLGVRGACVSAPASRHSAPLAPHHSRRPRWACVRSLLRRSPASHTTLGAPATRSRRGAFAPPVPSSVQPQPCAPCTTPRGLPLWRGARAASPPRLKAHATQSSQFLGSKRIAKTGNSKNKSKSKNDTTPCPRFRNYPARVKGATRGFATRLCKTMVPFFTGSPLTAGMAFALHGGHVDPKGAAMNCESCHNQPATHWLRIWKNTFAVCQTCGRYTMQHLCELPLVKVPDICLTPADKTTALRARWPFGSRKPPRPA